jgi:hypothetical protein
VDGHQLLGVAAIVASKRQGSNKHTKPPEKWRSKLLLGKRKKKVLMGSLSALHRRER